MDPDVADAVLLVYGLLANEYKQQPFVEYKIKKNKNKEMLGSSMGLLNEICCKLKIGKQF